MSDRGSHLLVGIGSPFGDDRLGWLVVGEIERRGGSNAHARCARAPADLLDWLEGVDRLVVCDACHGGGPAGSWQRFEWPTTSIDDVAFCGTHDMSLPATLTLADQLGLLPKQTTIWGLTVEHNSNVVGAVGHDRGEPAIEWDLSPPVRSALAPFVAVIERDLNHA
jgi:hydrogenase maturation protease